jgi:hypothetical protein
VSIDVLYIGGYTRSGSTLLSSLLGGLPGYVAAGELRDLWQRGVRDNQLCSCGQPFLSCPFWSAVGDRAFGGWPKIDADDLARVGAELLTSDRYLPGLLGPRFVAGRRGTRLLRRYSESMTALYASVRDVSGGSVIVDSSKLPAAALATARSPDVRLRVLHLVRDSRGVAFSWAKRGVVRPEITAGRTYMDTYAAGFTAVRWAYHNLLLEALRLRHVPCSLVRYEAMVRAPGASICGALERLGMPVAASARAALDSRRVPLDSSHTIGGNPMRFAGDDQPLEVDEAWRDEMPASERRKVMMLTWPLLLRYGYLRAAPQSPDE